jgi:hypothetical protein
MRFRKKIRSRLSQGMLAIIRCRIFVFYLAIQNIKIKIYRTIILPVVLYGCETWSLKLRDKHKLRVLESRVLRKKFEERGNRGVEKTT